MKKLLKAALVLMALALMSVACSKAKTMGIVGTYYGGNLKMDVSSAGYATINAKDASINPENATSEEIALIMINQYATDYSFNLMPWDLTAEKTTLNYTAKRQINVNQGSTPAQYVEVEVKFDFTKEKENYKCVVSTSLPEEVKTLLNTYLASMNKTAVGNDIKIELTKPISK